MKNKQQQYAYNLLEIASDSYVYAAQYIQKRVHLKLELWALRRQAFQ